MTKNEENTLAFEYALQQGKIWNLRLGQAINRGDEKGQRAAERELENWNRRLELLSGMYEIADREYIADMKRYAQDVAKWILMHESGQLDPEVRFPDLPMRHLPF
jgi:hypothetical protein